MFLQADSESRPFYPGIEPAYLLAERIVVSIICILSIIGATLVIFSFLCNTKTGCNLKELYYKICCGYQIRERDSNNVLVTKYRVKSFNFILINLSVADIIVAASHFWGLQMKLESEFAPNYTEYREHNLSAISTGYNISCITQAAFTAFSTVASFFWTDILAIFLAFNLIFEKCSNNCLARLKKDTAPEEIAVAEEGNAPNCCESPFFMYILFPLIGWAVPMVMVVAFATYKELGYTEDYDGGWCYFYLNPNTMTRGQRNELMNYGYEMWLWGSVCIVLLCTAAYSIVVCIRKKLDNEYRTGCTEFRYLSVGIAFALLRIPSTTINVYLMASSKNYRTVAAAVITIIADATISMQGAVNGVIYLCCRNKVKGKCCYRRNRDGYNTIQ